VADGVSAAPFSHLGANVTCRYAVEYCLREPAMVETSDWHHLLDGCAWAVIEAAQRLHALPDPDPARAEQDLATTLCVAVVTVSESGALVRATSVGDSGIAVLRDNEIVPLLGGKTRGPDGIISTSVVPLPRVPVSPAAGEWRLEINETLLVGTDGVWDPLGDGHGSVAGFLVGALGAQLPGQADFLRVVDFYKQTYDDDRTLVAVRLSGDEAGEISAP
jgi:serine/threonine protein phosphatase PrpC